jgi:hypothetical protein
MKLSYWRKSTNDSEGKLVRNSDAALGTIFRITVVLKSKQKLFIFPFPKAAQKYQNHLRGSLKV